MKIIECLSEEFEEEIWDSDSEEFEARYNDGDTYEYYVCQICGETQDHDYDCDYCGMTNCMEGVE